MKFCKFALLAGAMTPAGLAPIASAAVHESFVLSSSPTVTGGNASDNDMIFASTPPTSPGTMAQGVQASGSTAKNNAAVTAANVTFKFNVGPTVDSLNATYGAGGWTISNPQLTYQYTLYANSTVFGEGAGTFDTYWVANDNWTAGTNDPAYAINPASLTAWAGSDADLASTNYAWTPSPVSPTSASWTTNKNGPTMTTTLASDPAFLGDITGATAANDPNVSLYLLPTSSTVGLTIFTGGGTSLPTLSFDVNAVPEPATVGPLAAGGLMLLRRDRRSARRA